MTENERQEMLKDIRDGYIDVWDNMAIDELFESIEKEHLEVKQYRQVGTVGECRNYKYNARIAKVEKAGLVADVIARFAESLRYEHEFGGLDIFDAIEVATASTLASFRSTLTADAKEAEDEREM